MDGVSGGTRPRQEHPQRWMRCLAYARGGCTDDPCVFLIPAFGNLPEEGTSKLVHPYPDTPKSANPGP